jgi:hypothetical protein
MPVLDNKKIALHLCVTPSLHTTSPAICIPSELWSSMGQFLEPRRSTAHSCRRTRASAPWQVMEPLLA